MRVSFCVKTLGCKLNQLESDSIAASMARAGHSVVDAEREADIVVLNSCTVTGKAEQKGRREARKSLGGGGVLIVTGCYAELNQGEIESLLPDAIVLKGSGKSLLHELGPFLASLPSQPAASLRAPIKSFLGKTKQAIDDFSFEGGGGRDRSRPALKVQDGCDNACAYCRVHLARGPSRGIDAGLAIERLKALEGEGFAEAVITGVNLSQYPGPGGLPGLVRSLLGATSRISLRLSSYEPDAVDGAFLEIAAERRVRPHFHLAVQALSAPVLASMGRRYGPERVVEAVEALRRVRGDPFISCDIIAGFPGEGQERFEEGLAIARGLGFAWIHAYPFSARPGTRAASMRPRVPERIAGERVAALEELAKKGRAAYAARWAGIAVEAVEERSEGPLSAWTSENYLKIAAPGPGRPGKAAMLATRLPGPEAVTRGFDLDALAVGAL